MTEENLKDFTVNWIVGGLLLFSLLTFAITFMYDNNSTALNDGTGDIFSETSGTLEDDLIETSEDSNTLLNITSNTNPEVSDLGSRDSVATSFGTKDSSTSKWEASKKLIAWVFAGDAGKILLGTIGGLIGFVVMFYIWRFIRNGL